MIVSNEEEDSSQGSSAHLGETWEQYFGFDQPYPNQANAVEAGISAGEQNGFFVMEGPCGTGKTMAALTTALTLIRESRKYDQILVVTAVKQQLQQFVSDLRTINRDLDKPVKGVTLTGKTDLCPYALGGVFDTNVNGECEELRDNTASVVDTDTGVESSQSLPGDTARANKIRSVRDTADTWWDSTTAEDLVKHARMDADSFQTLSNHLEVNGETAPYPRHIPTVPESMATANGEPEFCPFEAEWYARNKGSPVGFEDGTNHVLDIDQYLGSAVGHGICPHRVMSVLLENAEIVIGNYNHLFDRRTRQLTDSIIDESTFVIIDEAHRLEDRVRDLLSDTLGEQTIRHARGDIDYVMRYANESSENRDQISAYLDDFALSLQDLSRVISFYTDVLGWLQETIDEYLAQSSEYGKHHELRDEDPGETIEIPLRDPSSTEQDELTTWGIEKGYDSGFWKSLRLIGEVIEEIHTTINPDRSCVASAVGALFKRWYTLDDSTYFREIELEYSPKQPSNQDYEWEQWFTPRLVQYNCLPRDALATIFSAVGGGILMSATLEPIDVFRDVTGINQLNSGRARSNRPVTERSYELPFPTDNRASWIIDITPYTASNRGPIGTDPLSSVRQHYISIMTSIAESHGNILLCLPNYAEAAWAGTILSESVSKPVLTDYSSSNTETNELKRSFFAGDGKVLVTSTRGTLTEGVDYDGDKLHTCAVIGLPLVNIGSPRVQAVKHAYGEEFGTNNAFDYSLSIPAVRRSRQALGRVIRGPKETGVRILVDNRYTPNHPYASVFEYLPSHEQDEFITMQPEFLETQLTEFWAHHA